MTQHEYNGFAVAAVILLLLILSLFVLWIRQDKRHEEAEGRLVVIEDALNLSGEPLALVDEPTQPQPVETPTEPMRRVQLAGGARVRPSPRPRGRHRAGEAESQTG